MTKYAIQVEGVGKQYFIGQKDQEDVLVNQMIRTLTGPVRRLRKLLQGQQTGAAELDEQFWALRDISFNVEPGEVVGVIGHNGAGKSTLLKLLSRITYPTEGRMVLNGRVGSLLEVGTGFHEELTGRENVYLNGTVLGMTRSEVRQKFDEIVDFAGVEKFIDTPVKHYSSGMRVRLAFAVAAHLDPEILLIDEVLSVGDAEFQRKSIGKMNDVAQSGRTVLFVSHNLAAVRDLCTRAILLDSGEMVTDGAVEHTLDAYLGTVQSSDGEMTWEGGIANEDVDEFSLHAVRIRNHKGNIASVIDFRESYSIEIEYAVHKPLPRLRVGFKIMTPTGIVVMSPYDVDTAANQGERTTGTYMSRCEIPGHLLAPGSYHIMVSAGIINRKHLCRIDRALSLTILDTLRKDPNEPGDNRPGILLPDLQWDVSIAERTY